MDIKSYALAGFVGLNLFTAPVVAAFIADGNHAFGFVELVAGQCPDHCTSTGDFGERRADTATQFLSDGVRDTDARGWVETNNGLELKVTTSSSAPNATSSISSTAQARAVASYRDVILPLAHGAPAQLSLNFSIPSERLRTFQYGSRDLLKAADGTPFRLINSR